ncbi:MAG: alkaline phosphatase family protein [Candidatus Bathyarchaeia archaeon]|jgi:phosphonoacetate hydrolase
MIDVNGTSYKDNLDEPVVIVCVDGGSPDYIDKAMKEGYAPTFKRFKDEGFYSTAKSIIPSTTNPNNIGIITGALPDVNGVPSNWIYDRKSGVERSLESPRDLRCKTILQVFHENGIRVASVTTKDKLRLMLGEGWYGINISAELAHGNGKIGSIKETIKNAMDANKGNITEKTDPWMYTEEPSHYALELAIAIMESIGPYTPDFLYVSLTDYIPHRYAPGSSMANSYFKRIDNYLGTLDRLGCVIGITADHGMNDKYNADGSPHAIWLDEILDRSGVNRHWTILPITDKYGAHHGSLGGVAWVYLDEVQKAMEILSEIDGVEKIMGREEASKTYSLPAELIGDIVVFGDERTVFGTEQRRHSSVPIYLRSHGSLHEQDVPFIINKPLNEKYNKRTIHGIRNFQICDYAINGTDTNLN